ncbi:hypothetical protein LCM28_05545 [Salipiger pacificus]|nr:hypothetical protein [Alloyangia pacifica]
MDKSPKLIFKVRPKAISGDMRITWRVSVVLLMLNYSRSKRASLAKLHILNDALRSERSRGHLEVVLAGNAPLFSWAIRVEPAFARALDFLVAEGLAEWVVASERTSAQLTKKGKTAAEKILSEEDLFSSERSFLKKSAMPLTENLVNGILAASKVRV